MEKNRGKGRKIIFLWSVGGDGRGEILSVKISRVYWVMDTLSQRRRLTFESSVLFVLSLYLVSRWARWEVNTVWAWDGYLFCFIPWLLLRYLFFPTAIHSLKLPFTNWNLPFSNRRGEVQLLGRSDRILHETRPVDKGEGKERRRQALLWFLQNPQ